MEKMKMESMDIRKKNLRILGDLFPNLVTEVDGGNGIELKLNIEEFESTFSDVLVDGSSEHYEFSWPGKAAARSEAYSPIRKSIRFLKKESKNWETTGNIYIKGDNLDALKLLQESYLDKIKLIYIDPPYNTGSDFVYKDDFRLTESDYERMSGNVDDMGVRLVKNTDSNGRFHSDWCSMIYMRLILARNLLRKDGSIFISIDDYEVENLLKICDEVFGAKNHVGTIVWERAFSPKNDAKYFSASHDYIVVYAKSIEDFKIGKLPRTEEANARYKNPDNDPRGPWSSGDMTAKTYSADYDYPITTPGGKVINPAPGRCWFTSKERMQQMIAEGRVWFGEDGNNTPRFKRYLADMQDGMTPTTLWKYQDVGHNQEGRQELKKLFGDKGYFDGPKPQRLMHRILQIANVGKDDIVLDFFSGSASTAHAVMDYNVEDSGGLCVTTLIKASTRKQPLDKRPSDPRGHVLQNQSPVNGIKSVPHAHRERHAAELLRGHAVAVEALDDREEHLD